MADFKKLKQGESLSETQFYIVEKIAGDKVQLRPDKGDTIVVDSGYVNSFLTSAEQFDKDVTLTRTEITQIVKNHPFTVMTINYNKQVKEVDIKKEIQEAYENSTPKEFSTKMAKAVKRGLEGEERIIKGRHYNGYDDFGRLQFIDMDIPQDPSKTYDVRSRLVDPRTISWVIIKGTKYVAK